MGLEVAWIGFGGVVIGGLISSLTTWLLQLGERRKYRRERSWDLRREAYTTIIGSLDRARAWLPPKGTQQEWTCARARSFG